MDKTVGAIKHELIQKDNKNKQELFLEGALPSRNLIALQSASSLDAIDHIFVYCIRELIFYQTRALLYSTV